ncbi:MAG: hypothetical protein IPL65_01480 [Lewinellaceae bacterium]|nr:hypothetical protein [Lewinellaceae bacterium]
MKKIFFLFFLLSSILAFRASAQCQLDVNIQQTGILSCTNASVDLTANVSPATGDLHYEWYGPNGGVVLYTASITASQPGFYTVYVSDSLTGCWGGDTIQVLSDGTIPVVTVGVISNGGCDGTGPSSPNSQRPHATPTFGLMDSQHPIL